MSTVEAGPLEKMRQPLTSAYCQASPINLSSYLQPGSTGCQVSSPPSSQCCLCITQQGGGW